MKSSLSVHFLNICFSNEGLLPTFLSFFLSFFLSLTQFNPQNSLTRLTGNYELTVKLGALLSSHSAELSHEEAAKVLIQVIQKHEPS
jgi:hypothetical protein